MLTLVATAACSSTFVVVPHPAGQYAATDTLYAIHRGDEVRVTFHFDSIMRVDTVTRVDTAWVEGRLPRDTILRIDTLLRVDTLRTVVTDTVVRTEAILRVDTVRVPAVERVVRVDTVTRVDTVRVPVTETIVRVDTMVRVDTVRIPTTERIVRVDTMVRVDTVRIPTTETIVRADTVLRVDTLRLTVTDTLRLTVTDTLRLAVSDTVVRTVRIPGRRMLFVPPGHYPPAGQCRVWIHNLPPGQQQQAAPCDQLRDVPGGAFVLFGGEAWDFDYDWLTAAETDPEAVPPEITGLQRRR
ncbi:MAG TPA: hypothetical protein VK929_07545 [Longimicrobiales bacterium]|nr:hypothetical protein [Longimicrobiales bacterium]